MQPTRNVRPRNKAAKLSINLSVPLEQTLGEAIRQQQREQWLSENEEAMEAYNAHVDKCGVFSEGLRNF